MQGRHTGYKEKLYTDRRGYWIQGKTINTGENTGYRDELYAGEDIGYKGKL